MRLLDGMLFTTSWPLTRVLGGWILCRVFLDSLARRANDPYRMTLPKGAPCKKFLKHLGENFFPVHDSTFSIASDLAGFKAP